jgi:ABC-2 type transport system ATP-binding protein
VFLTTHSRRRTLCDHIGIIHRGRLVAQGSMAELRAGGTSGASLEERFMDTGATKSNTLAIDWLAG